MRSIKELLQVMLENQGCFRTGLCNWSGCLYVYYKISLEEYELLYDYITKNRPSVFSSFDAFSFRNTDYYWNPGNIKPRIKWIKKHIKRNS